GPGVLRGAEQPRLGRREESELRYVRFADDDEPCATKAGDELAVLLRHVFRKVTRTARGSDALAVSQDVFDEHRRAEERTARRRGILRARRCARLVVHSRDDRVELRIQRVDTPNHVLDELTGFGFLAPYELGERRRV